MRTFIRKKSEVNSYFPPTSTLDKSESNSLKIDSGISSQNYGKKKIDTKSEIQLKRAYHSGFNFANVGISQPQNLQFGRGNGSDNKGNNENKSKPPPKNLDNQNENEQNNNNLSLKIIDKLITIFDDNENNESELEPQKLNNNNNKQEIIDNISLANNEINNKNRNINITNKFLDQNKLKTTNSLNFTELKKKFEKQISQNNSLLESESSNNDNQKKKKDENQDKLDPNLGNHNRSFDRKNQSNNEVIKKIDSRPKEDKNELLSDSDNESLFPEDNLTKKKENHTSLLGDENEEQSNSLLSIDRFDENNYENNNLDNNNVDNNNRHQLDAKTIETLERKFMSSKKNKLKRFRNRFDRGLDNLQYGRRAIFNAHNIIYKKKVNWKDDGLKQAYKVLHLPHKTPLSDTLKRYEELRKQYQKGLEAAKKNSYYYSQERYDKLTNDYKSALRRHKQNKYSENPKAKRKKDEEIIKYCISSLEKINREKKGKKQQEKNEAYLAKIYFQQKLNQLKSAKNYVVTKLNSQKKRSFGRYFFRVGGKIISAPLNLLYGTSKMVSNVFVHPKNTLKALGAILVGPIFANGFKKVGEWFKQNIGLPLKSITLWDSKGFKAYVAGGNLGGCFGRSLNIIASFMHNFVHNLMKFTNAIAGLASWIKMWCYGLGAVFSAIPYLQILTPVLAGIGSVSGAIGVVSNFLTASMGMLLDIWDEYSQIRLEKHNEKGVQKQQKMKQKIPPWFVKRFMDSKDFQEIFKGRKATLMERQAVAEELLHKRLWSWEVPAVAQTTLTNSFDSDFKSWSGFKKGTHNWYEAVKDDIDGSWTKTDNGLEHLISSNNYKNLYRIGSGQKPNILVGGATAGKIAPDMGRNEYLNANNTRNKAKNQNLNDLLQAKKDSISRSSLQTKSSHSPRLRSNIVNKNKGSLQFQRQTNLELDSLQTLQAKPNNSSSSLLNIVNEDLTPTKNIQRQPDLDPLPTQDDRHSNLKEKEEFMIEKIKAMKGSGTQVVLKSVNLFSKLFSIGKGLSNPQVKVEEMKMKPEMQEKFGKAQQVLKPDYDVNIVSQGASSVRDILSAI